MKNTIFALYKNVPIPEWAQKRAFSSIILLFTCFCTCTSQQHREIEDIYRQFRDTPSPELYKTGNEFLERNLLDEAMVCFSIVGNRYSSKMDSEEKRICAYALNNAGGISQLRSSYSTAFSYFKKAMQVSDTPLHQTYNNIAGIYLFYNDYTNASSYLSQAFDISLEQESWKSLSNTLQNMIFLGWKTDSLESLLPPVERYRSAAGLPHDLLYSYTIGIGDATIAAAQGHYQEAIGMLSRISLPADSIHAIVQGSSKAPLYIAKCYMALGDYAQALEHLRSIEQEMRKEGAMYMLMYVYNLQMECCQQTNNAEGVRKARYDLMNLKDSINTAEELEKIKNIEFFYEVDKYEKQVVELNQQKNSRTKIVIISSLALLVVALLLVVTVVQNRRLWESNKELYRKNDELMRQADSEKQQRSAHKAASPNLTPASNNADDMPAVVEKIFQKLDEVDFICQPDLTVERLAQAIGMHDRYVSQAINESTNKNFNTLLNEYRIREACKRLTDFDAYGLMTNETIAEGLGYKSRSHFIRTFKKVTGLTPSQYQKIARKELE